MPPLSSPRPAAPWSLRVEDVFSAYETSPKGLLLTDVEKRIQDSRLANAEHDDTVPGWRILLSQFSSPLVLILFGASFISFALGERTETFIIVFMLSISGMLGFVQEYRGERALRLLRKKLHRKTTVIRKGIAHRINMSDLVIGDVVELELGSIVPADVRLIRTEDLEIDESIITGESAPVLKSTEPVQASCKLPQEQTSMAFLGTHVVQGSGRAVVVGLGSQTEVGKTAALLSQKIEETSFQKGIREFGSFLLKLTAGLILVVSCILGFIHGAWSESLLFALALAVGISPELLPVIVTINLSRGALLLGRKGVLIKRLIGIEDLGNADIFCTDKTGTLTVGKLRVFGSINAHDAPSTEPLSYALHCLDIQANGKASSPIDEAILEEGKKRVKPAIAHATCVDIVSFDFHRRRMSSVISDVHGKRRLITKGAVTEVLDACAGLTHADRIKLQALSDRYADTGYRLIAVAQREIGAQQSYTIKDEHDLHLVGFILVHDAPKESAREAIAALQALNVRITVLTGDNERVTKHVAEQLHFHITGMLTGDDVERMKDGELEKAVETTNVFSRITPAHKLRVIQALKRRGHTVGYMGDGVNDAPALRAADVGISFEDAVDVAKEAASIILIKKNLSVLADGIREGRRTFVNTRTYLFSTISSNFGNMLSVAGASLLLPFIPLLPAQILLLNLLGDFSMLTISTDNVAEDEIRSPLKWDIRSISRFMYFFGPISSIADYATFALLIFVAHAHTDLFRSGWFILSITTQVTVISLLRTRQLSLKNMPSWPLLLSSAFAIGSALFLVNSPFGATFNLVPLPAWLYGALLAIVIGYATLTELGKMAYYRFEQNTK